MKFDNNFQFDNRLLSYFIQFSDISIIIIGFSNPAHLLKCKFKGLFVKNMDMSLQESFNIIKF